MQHVLVDSSVWIHCLSKRPPQKYLQQISLAKRSRSLATCEMIFLEVVRGARTKKEFNELKEEFYAMNWLSLQNENWNFACEMGFELARKGLHPPNTDLLIAAIAIQTNSFLLHCDKDFDRIASYYPLKLL
jgi:predicted nucleic acid-binding protein